MVTNIYISSDGFFRGNGLIPFLTREVSSEEIQFSTVFNEVIKDIKRLHDIYILSMLDDGKITGRERLLVCKEMDSLIGDLVLLRAILSEEKTEFGITNRNQSIYLRFKILKARWEGFGDIGTNHNLKINKIKEWVQTSYAQKLKNLIQYSQQALEDGILEGHERQVISNYIDKLLLGLIIVRDGIYTTKIS